MVGSRHHVFQRAIRIYSAALARSARRNYAEACLKGAKHVPRSVLITGGAGFIGANFVEHLLASDRDVRITNLDSLTYAGSLENLDAAMRNERHRFVHGDITDAELVNWLFGEGIDTVVHFAAESHVDRSITGPAAFVTTNVVGTFTLLEAARTAWLGSGRRDNVRFHHVSTDEVFGSLSEDDPPFRESTPYSPNSPTRRAKPDPITSSGRTITLTVCRSRSPAAPTTTVRTSTRKNSFLLLSAQLARTSRSRFTERG